MSDTERGWRAREQRRVRHLEQVEGRLEHALGIVARQDQELALLRRTVRQQERVIRRLEEELALTRIESRYE